MTKKTLADRTWTLVGVLGVVCIGIAVYLLAADLLKSTPAEEAKELFEDGRSKLEAGDVEGAIESLQAAVDKTGGLQPVYRTDLGIALLRRAQADPSGDQWVNAAEGHWLNALRINAVYARPYRLLAGLYEARGEKGNALAFYRAALALHPEPVPEGLPGKVAAIRAEIEEARGGQLATLRNDLRANPAELRAFLPLLLAELSDLRVPENDPPRAGIEAVLRSMGKGVPDLSELIERQRGAVGDRPESVLDRAGLGNLLLIAGEFEAARTVFDEAIGLLANDPAAILGAALSDLVAGAAGLDRIQNATAALNRNPVSWLALGAACLAADRTEAARKALFNALKLSPDVPEVYRLLAMSFVGADVEKDREAALRAYRRLLE